MGERRGFGTQGTRRLNGPIAMLLLVPCIAFGQSKEPEATLDKDQILIGQQAHLSLSVSYRADQGQPAIGWPNVADTLTGKIDVVKYGAVDTVPPDRQKDPLLSKLVRTLTITSWDSGYWAVPPFVFTVNGDTVETQPMLLTVNTVPVDTAAAIKDIKEIYEVPYGWMDWLREHWPWVAGGAGAAAVLAWAIVWFVRRSRRPKPVTVAVEPDKPLHVRTLLALEEVDKKKLWQQGLVKEYHSAVTDILRSYIEERFKVPALESTTDDLLGILRMSSMGTGQREQLANLLRMADMVKFAKWTPLPTENEQLLAGAVKLVQQTSEALSDAART
jgi:hypothetical protein